MVHEFLTWWLTQLSDCVPAQLRRHMQREWCRIVLDLDTDGYRVQAICHGEQDDFGHITATQVDSERGDQLRRFLAAQAQRPERITLRIAPGRYLARTVELPLVAEENLNEALGFQINRLTPFTPDQVLYFCGVSQRMRASKTLTAWLAIIPAAPIEAGMEMLGASLLTPLRTPSQLPPADTPLELEFATNTGRARHLLGIPRTALVLLTLLFGGVAGLHVFNRQITLEHVDRALSEERLRATEASQLLERIELLRTRAEWLRKARARQPLSVELLDELTQRLDDTTWLQRLDLRAGKLTMQGASQNASALLGVLEQSPLLRNARFESSVTRERDGESERFSISVDVAEPPPRQGAGA